MSELVAALVGAFVGFLGTYYCSLHLFRHQRKIEAASKLREAFVPIAAKCKSPREFRIKEEVFEVLPELEQAVVLYEPFLDTKTLSDFRSAWMKFCDLHNYRTINDLTPETGIGNGGDFREISESEQRRNTLSHVMGLIEYAPTK